MPPSLTRAPDGGPFVAHDAQHLRMRRREHDLLDDPLSQRLEVVELGGVGEPPPGALRHQAAAKLVGFDGADLRFVGELRVEHYAGQDLLENHVDDALWELMYFGKARP